MNRHQEVWIDGVEYDLVHVLRSTYWEVILVDVETDEIVERRGRIDI
jgi:hypothetical protein